MITSLVSGGKRPVNKALTPGRQALSNSAGHSLRSTCVYHFVIMDFVAADPGSGRNYRLAVS